MIIKWQKSNQHTDYGLFRVGDVIDAAARGIPDSTIGLWIRDGFAVEEKPKPVSELRPAKKKTNIGG
jgi:hypothetical protein